MEVPFVGQRQTSNEPLVDGSGDDRVKTPEGGSQSVVTSSLPIERIAVAIERIAGVLHNWDAGGLDVRVDK